mmetsp:Transcript_12583/g.15616  ORF Transcript_12583/g.15616 Transcript_12583/m.15616 type:complete len:348 (+) Transcript_12583:319-1362(+)|eukprot:CAMPEP_0204840630 /NCGR_PEP_ID=MMETSP1346-20131115/38318_1 /ASSEMBLY_ACC=CAM_ASM_000771 /TAXON_ID=215587 /ORGANISM="Aplanochytrium stocchinoi, Strain GSBS06" /LENGTH=347 /DNA_ID=CAMNT_0051978147 /DNA_START=218 /DNA_END=1261 /DNA_ORIENTATION=-
MGVEDEVPVLEGQGKDDDLESHFFDEMKCRCCDEERCCPGFWKDNGIPPCWPFSWVFDPKNPYLNDNDCAHKFGHCGLRCADKNRKPLMGTALALTALAIIITGFGCFALSTDPQILRLTAWGISYHRNVTTETGTVIYLGLRRFVVRECDEAPTNSFFDLAECRTTKAVFWDDLDCNEDGSGFAFGYPCNEVNICKQQAVANQFGAFVTAATLLLALNGCLTRIRRVADTNLQKFLGTIPDAFGVISLGAAMLNFGLGCYNEQAETGDRGQALFYLAGPGYIAYSVCWVVAVTRTIMHSLVPVPGKGLHTGFQKDRWMCCFGCCCVEYDRKAAVRGEIEVAENETL